MDIETQREKKLKHGRRKRKEARTPQDCNQKVEATRAGLFSCLDLTWHSAGALKRFPTHTPQWHVTRRTVFLIRASVGDVSHFFAYNICEWAASGDWELTRTEKWRRGTYSCNKKVVADNRGPYDPSHDNGDMKQSYNRSCHSIDSAGMVHLPEWLAGSWLRYGRVVRICSRSFLIEYNHLGIGDILLKYVRACYICSTFFQKSLQDGRDKILRYVLSAYNCSISAVVLGNHQLQDILLRYALPYRICNTFWERSLQDGWDIPLRYVLPFGIRGRFLAWGELRIDYLSDISRWPFKSRGWCHHNQLWRAW